MAEYGYVEWHAEVARILQERHPSAVVSHETQLGGDINGVVVECGDDTVVAVSDDALGVYTRAQWFEGEGEEDAEFPFSEAMGTPEEAAAKADPYIVAAGC